MADTPDNEQTGAVGDGTMNLTEAVRFTGMSKPRLYKLMQSGELAFVQAGRRRLVSRASLRAWLLARVVPPPATGPEGCPHDG